MKAPAPVSVTKVAVRLYGGTYIARIVLSKLTASCTAGPHQAAWAVAAKWLPSHLHCVGPFTLQIVRDDAASTLFDLLSWHLVPADQRPLVTLSRTELCARAQS